MQKENKLTRNFIIGTFVTLYVMVSIISTIHVIDFFRLSNPEWLAITLALSFEVGAAASLASIIALKKMNKSIVWVLFFTLTAMQAMGNAYFAYMHLKDFQGWIELFGLIDSEIIEQKRILSIVSGAILPLVALGFIKSLVDYIKPDEVVNTVNDQITDAVTQVSNEDILKAAEKIQTQKIWDKVAELREEGKLPTPTQEDIEDEPTALANSQYREQEVETIVDEIPEGEVEEPIELIEKREEALIEMMRLDQENGLYEEPILGNEEPIEAESEVIVYEPVIEEPVVEQPVAEPEVIVEEPVVEQVIEQPIAEPEVIVGEVIEEQVTEESDEKKNLN
jgi:hypothetical protein